MKKIIIACILIAGCFTGTATAQKASSSKKAKQATVTSQGVLAPKPVFRDPVYDGAADPIVIWNPQVEKWWMFYTNRRATMTELPGVSWVFKTPLGIAESTDGANWNYVGTANLPDLPPECGGDSATFWAPDIILGDDAKWHMYLSIQPGIAERWGVVQGFIAHLTSTNLRDWKYESRINGLGERSYDADVIKMPDGVWRMYYRDPAPGDFKMVESKDLYHWSEPKDALKARGEGPILFQWKGYFWFIIDDWQGMAVFRSTDGDNWERQPGESLMPDGTGTGNEDVPNGLHGEILISNGRAYMYYFTHPGRVGEDRKKDTYEQRRTSIQVVELTLDANNWILADRNSPTYVKLAAPITGPRVLFIGDSITDGNWGGGGYQIPSSVRNMWDQNHLYGSGYMYLCAAYYLGKYPEREYQFFNRGISGNTLHDLEVRWEEDVIQVKPDVLSVLVGINDVDQYFHKKTASGKETAPFDIADWEKKYRSLLNRTLQSNPKVKLVLGTPFIYKTGNMCRALDFDQRNALVHQCINVVERIAKDYKAVYLPYHEMFHHIYQTSPTSIDTYWIWDGIHPTVAGHQRMTELWIQQTGL